MSYVDAGYAIALAAMAVYALSLVLRQRRLERVAASLRDAPSADVGIPEHPGGPVESPNGLGEARAIAEAAEPRDPGGPGPTGAPGATGPTGRSAAGGAFGAVR